MALKHSPSIVSDGLILYLDAANRRSYPGSGSIWYDLSENKYNNTLYNSPIFASGFILFDGIAQYASAGDNDNLHPELATIEVWTRAINESNLDHVTNIVGKGDWNSASGHWHLGYKNGTQLSFAYNIESWSVGASYNLSSFDATAWHNIVGVCSQNNNALYIDGNFISNDTAINGTRILNNLEFQIARSSYYGNFYNGAITIVKMYNRPLSDVEIKQNFNAMRSRFGI